jgi:hypothetical protein
MRLFTIFFPLALVVLSGCNTTNHPGGSSSAGPSGGPTTVVAADFIGYGQGQIAQLGLKATRARRAKASIVGLGYALAIFELGSGRTLTSALALSDIRGGELPKGTSSRGAAEGHEFVAVSLTTVGVQGDNPLLKATDAQPREELSVKVGDRQPVALGRRHSDGLLVVSAPVGAPVTLIAADVRPQSLDLRAGVRVDEVAMFYPALPKQGAGSGPGLTFTTAPFLIGTWIGPVEVTPATQQHGWAPAGQAWLVVPIQVVVTQQACDDVCAPRSMTLDIGKSVKITSGAQQYTLRSGTGQTSFTLLQSGFTGWVSAMFQVPETFRSGTVQLAFNGSVSLANGSTSQLRATKGELFQVTLR